MRFLDTNILLRYLTRDDAEKAERALALLRRVENGDEKVFTSPLVIFETIFTLQKHYKVSRDLIRDLMRDIIGLRGLQLQNKRLYEQALELYATHNVSFADAFNVAYISWQHATEIYSWDEDFDKFDDIVRVEPAPVQPTD
jgi:predicted nucleic acid-binding protein